MGSKHILQTFIEVNVLPVPGEVLFVVESAAALVTDPVPLVLMELHVQVELVLLDKPFATDGASKRTIRRMKLDMLVQIALDPT